MTCQGRGGGRRRPRSEGGSRVRCCPGPARRRRRSLCRSRTPPRSAPRGRRRAGRAWGARKPGLPRSVLASIGLSASILRATPKSHSWRSGGSASPRRSCGATAAGAGGWGLGASWGDGQGRNGTQEAHRRRGRRGAARPERGRMRGGACWAHLRVIQEGVLRLHVAVDYPLGMTVLQRTDELQEEVQSLVLADEMALDVVGKRSSRAVPAEARRRGGSVLSLESPAPPTRAQQGFSEPLSAEVSWR